MVAPAKVIASPILLIMIDRRKHTVTSAKVTRALTLVFIPFFLKKLFSGKIESSKYVNRIAAKSAVVIQKNKLVHFDGEAYELSERLEINVHPSSLSVLVKK